MAEANQDHLISTAIRAKISKEKSAASIANMRGKSTRIKMFKAKENTNTIPISHEEMFNWKTDLDLSTRKVCSVIIYNY